MASDGSELLALAKKFASSLGGTKDPSLLANDFIYITPSVEISDKSKYLSEAAKSYSAIKRCLPDFSSLTSSVTVDTIEPNTVRYISKASGTLSGPFAYKGDVYLPNNNYKNKLIEFAPSVTSLKFKNGEVSNDSFIHT